MSWKEFCEMNGVPKIYRESSLETLNIPSPTTDFKKLLFQFLKEPTSLILQGDPGRGKTFFMYALISELFALRKMPMHWLRYFNADSLDRRIDDEMAKYKSATYFLQGLVETPFLFIDDFGIEGSKEKAERNYYYLLDKRLANDEVTVLSTNLEDGEILQIFGSRIDSRLKQCVKLVFDGPDLRKPRGFA